MAGDSKSHDTEANTKPNRWAPVRGWNTLTSRSAPTMRSVARLWDLAFHAAEMGVPPPKSDGRHPNTGVMVLSQCHLEMFSIPPKFVNVALEQGWLNIRRLQLGLPFWPLPIEFNHGKFYGLECPMENSYVKHFQSALMGVDEARRMASLQLAYDSR